MSQKTADNNNCFKCGEPGHWASQCPEQKKPLTPPQNPNIKRVRTEEEQAKTDGLWEPDIRRCLSSSLVTAAESRDAATGRAQTHLDDLLQEMHARLVDLEARFDAFGKEYEKGQAELIQAHKKIMVLTKKNSVDDHPLTQEEPQ